MISGTFKTSDIGLEATASSTIDFIAEIMKGNASAYSNYAFTKTTPTINSLNWVEGTNDKQTIYEFDSNLPVTIRNDSGDVLYEGGVVSSDAVSMEEEDGKTYVTIWGDDTYAVESPDKEDIQVSYWKAGMKLK